jgi:integrase
MNNIRKRGQSYQAQVRLSGGRSASATFRTKAEAQSWVREQSYKLAQQPRDMNLRITISELVTRFLDEKIPLRHSAKNEAIRLRAFKRDALADKPLAELTKYDLSRYTDQRLKHVKTNTVVRDLGLLRTVVGTAINEWGVKTNNPFDDFKLKRRPDQRYRRVSQSELTLLLDTGSGSPFVKPAICIAVETAMRLGEILSLTWDKVDLEQGFAELNRTKNGHGRVVPLTDRAIAAIGCLPMTNHHLIPVKPDSLKQAWRRLVLRAGIEDLRFHDLRHEAISRLLEKGLTIPEAASVSGHRTASMLARYAHPDPLKVRQKMMENG